MAIKAIRKKEKENGEIKSCFVEAKQKKALVMMYSCIAEVKTKEAGENVYLNCEWMDQDPEEIYFEATKESIYDFLVYERNDIEVLEAIREELLDECVSMDEAMDSRFSDIYEKMIEEVKTHLSENGFDISFI